MVVQASSVASSGRRGFFRGVAAAAGAVAGVLLGGRLVRSARAAQLPAPDAALPDAPGNELVRMQQELQSALTRAPQARRWIMMIDPRKCIGCQACVVACRAENVTGPEGTYRRVSEGPTGTYPNLTNVFMPTNCVQCDDPPCARAVPAGMIRKRPDGIVEFDYARLKGQHAQAAAAACPYRAVHVDQGKRFTEGTPAVQAYENRQFAEYQGTWKRGPAEVVTGAARKCHFCAHLLDGGMLPACVTTCIGGAMFFGDANDSRSLVSGLLREHRTVRIHNELGIEPRVYYVEDKLPQVRQYACASCH